MISDIVPCCLSYRKLCLASIRKQDEMSHGEQNCLLTLPLRHINSCCCKHYTCSICDVIKQNESELNIDLEIEPHKGNKSFFVFYCFDNLSVGHNFRMTCPILIRFSVKHSSFNGEKHKVEN